MKYFFDGEHPVVAVLAVIAIVASVLLIAWARYELHGAENLGQALEHVPFGSATGFAP